MAARTSLRKKLATTFLAGSLLTVVLFSLAINRIVRDYFQTQAAVNRQFVQDQSRQEVRANLAFFKDCKRRRGSPSSRWSTSTAKRWFAQPTRRPLATTF